MPDKEMTTDTNRRGALKKLGLFGLAFAAPSLATVSDSSAHSGHGSKSSRGPSKQFEPMNPDGHKHDKKKQKYYLNHYHRKHHKRRKPRKRGGCRMRKGKRSCGG